MAIENNPLHFLKNGKHWNARPILKNGQPAIEFDVGWINYLDENDDWQPIDCLIEETGSDFRVTKAPFNFIAPFYSDEEVFFESDCRYDIFDKSKITADPFGVYMKAMDAVRVKGELFDINGDGRLDAVIYKQAFPQWDADLIYYVKHGRAPRLEKLVRFNSKIIDNADIRFHLRYTDTPEITPRDEVFSTNRLDEAILNRQRLKDGVIINHKKGFYIRKWQETQKRGIGIKDFRIWDSGPLSTRSKSTRKILEIDADIKSDGNGFSILTKHIDKTFFEDAIFPVFTDASSTFYPDADVESSSVDGYAGQNNGDLAWTSYYNGAGNVSNDSSANTLCVRIYSADAGNPKFRDLSRSFFLFDTSALPDGATIDSATFSVYVTSVVDTFSGSLSLDTSNPASNTAIANTDFATANFGSTRQASDIALSSLTTSAYNDFALNATGKGNISKTGITKFGLRLAADLDNSAPSPDAADQQDRVDVNYADNGTNKPKLVVVYTTVTTQTATIQAKARIKDTGVAKTITSKARIKDTGVFTTIQAKARINNGNIKTIQAKAAVKQYGVAQTVTSKARVKDTGVAKTVQAKARLAGSLVKTIQAKATIQKEGNYKTITSKARLKCLGKSGTIQAVSRIKKTVVATATAKARIRAPRRGFVGLPSKQQSYPVSMNDGRFLN